MWLAGRCEAYSLFARVEFLQRFHVLWPHKSEITSLCLPSSNFLGGSCVPQYKLTKLFSPCLEAYITQSPASFAAFCVSTARIVTFLPWTLIVALNDRLICQWLNLESRYQSLFCNTTYGSSSSGLVGRPSKAADLHVLHVKGLTT
jgi:hypothetical protein